MTSELENSFKGPGFGVTFLYYFALAAMIGAIATIEIKHVSVHSSLPYQIGVAFALPFAVINAWTKRSKTLSVSVNKKNKFERQLIQTLEEFDFMPSADPEQEDGVTYLEFRKEGLASFLAGTIYVAIADKEAVIASRASIIKRLETKI